MENATEDLGTAGKAAERLMRYLRCRESAARDAVADHRGVGCPDVTQVLAAALSLSLPEAEALRRRVAAEASGRRGDGRMKKGAVTEKSGNILDSDAEWIVIPVNCVGTMGAGLAKQAKARWPEVDAEYRRACRQGLMRPGRCLLAAAGNGRAAVLFPSKDHWKNASTMELVETAARSLEELARERRPESIAIPPVGCGLGGLNWTSVKAVILEMDLPEGCLLEVHAP